MWAGGRHVPTRAPPVTFEELCDKVLPVSFYLPVARYSAVVARMHAQGARGDLKLVGKQERRPGRAPPQAICLPGLLARPMGQVAKASQLSAI